MFSNFNKLITFVGRLMVGGSTSTTASTIWWIMPG